MASEILITIHQVLGFVACRVTSKILGIGSTKRSWGDVKTIKPGNLVDVKEYF